MGSGMLEGCGKLESMTIPFVGGCTYDYPLTEEEKEAIARQIEEQMLSAARDLDFERAAKLRDQLLEMRGEAPQKNEVQKKRRRTRESTRHH